MKVSLNKMTGRVIKYQFLPHDTIVILGKKNNLISVDHCVENPGMPNSNRSNSVSVEFARLTPKRLRKVVELMDYAESIGNKEMTILYKEGGDVGCISIG